MPQNIPTHDREAAPTSAIPIDRQPDMTVADSEQTQPPWFLTVSDQMVVCILCLLCLCWIGFRWLILSHWGQQETELLRQPQYEYAYQLDLNQATWIELSLLDGIGEVLGKKIVANREQQGPFRHVDDLLRVNGIGEKTLAKLRPYLYIEESSKNKKLSE